MNRIKREIRKRGFKLEADYMTLPDMETGLESVIINSETATMVRVYPYIVVRFQFCRNGNVVEIPEEW